MCSVLGLTAATPPTVNSVKNRAAPYRSAAKMLRLLAIFGSGLSGADRTSQQLGRSRRQAAPKLWLSTFQVACTDADPALIAKAL